MFAFAILDIRHLRHLRHLRDIAAFPVLFPPPPSRFSAQNFKGFKVGLFSDSPAIFLVIYPGTGTGARTGKWQCSLPRMHSTPRSGTSKNERPHSRSTPDFVALTMH